MHRLRYLREEMSLRGHPDHQPPVELGEGDGSPLPCQLFQTPPAAHSTPRRGTRPRWHQWHRQIYRTQNSPIETEAEFRQSDNISIEELKSILFLIKIPKCLYGNGLE